MADCVIPVVFPDYLIAVPRPSVKIDIPDFLPWDDQIEDFLDNKTTKVPDLGHAGVLFVHDTGKKGITKYYEYGRYSSNKGETRRRSMPDCRYVDGKPDLNSLTAVFQQMSKVAGQNGRISGSYIEVPGKYRDMLKYAQSRVAENKVASRESYDIFTNSCVHFAMSVVAAAGIQHEYSVTDARPISYISNMQRSYADVEFSNGALTIEGW